MTSACYSLKRSLLQFCQWKCLKGYFSNATIVSELLYISSAVAWNWTQRSLRLMWGWGGSVQTNVSFRHLWRVFHSPPLHSAPLWNHLYKRILSPLLYLSVWNVQSEAETLNTLGSNESNTNEINWFVLWSTVDSICSSHNKMRLDRTRVVVVLRFQVLFMSR